MSGDVGNGLDGGGLDGGAEGAGGAESFSGYNGSGDPLPASAGSPGASGAHPGNGERQPSPQQPSPSRHHSPPHSWSKDYHQHWSAIPEQVRGYVHERESEAAKRISELGPGAKEHASIAQAFERYGMHKLPQGVSHSQVIERLLAAGQALKANPGAVIAHLARTNGVDLAQLIGFGGNAPKMLETLGRRAEQAERTVATLQQELARRDAQGRESEQKRRAENARMVAEAKRQSSLNQRSGMGGPPTKGTIRDSLQRHADRLYGR